jgi:putative hemolysin
MPAWLPIPILLGLIGLSALAAGAEIALLSLNPLRLETKARQGDRMARVQIALRRHPQRMLTTVLVVGNLLNAGLTTYAALLATDVLAPLLGLTQQQAVLLNTAVIATVIIVVCDLIPKTLGAVRPEGFAKVVTWPIALFDRLFIPIHWVMGWTVSPLLRLLTRGSTEADKTPNIEEVRTMLSLAHAGGHIEHADVLFAREALHFSKKNLQDVMTPRVDVIAVSDIDTVGDAMTGMVQSGFSRLPVYHEDLDEIIGVVLLKDLVTMSLQRAKGGRDPLDAWADEPVVPYMRPAPRYPGTKGVDGALAELRKERTHLAVVVDEHGGTAGVVTLEDILEELVGDIQDESDSAHSADVIRRSEGVLLVTGRARLDALPELEDVDLGETESQTLGGLLMERLGRAIVVGDSILLPCRPGHAVHIGAGASHDGPLAQDVLDSPASNGYSEAEPRSTTGLRVTALKVMRTRIKLMKVEAVTELLPEAS